MTLRICSIAVPSEQRIQQGWFRMKRRLFELLYRGRQFN
jgi:hypothetical protein